MFKALSRDVTIAGFAGKRAIFFVFAGKTGKQYHFSLEDAGKLEFLVFLSACLIWPRQDVKRPVGFVYDSV